MNFFKYLVINTFVGLFAFVSMWTMSNMSQGEAVEQELPAGSPSMVIKRCVPTVEGVFPTGVMLQEIGGRARTLIVRNDDVVGQALEKQIDGKDYLPTYRVLQFCR